MKQLMSSMSCMALSLALWGGTVHASAPLVLGGVPNLPTSACETSDCKVYPFETSLKCTTGSCDPGDLNARGIYIGNQNDYCLENSHGWSRICPEAFVNTEDGVYVALRDTRPSLFPRWYGTLGARVEDESGIVLPVNLLSVSGDKNLLTIQYTKPPSTTVITAQGSALGALKLQLSFTRPAPFPLPLQTYQYELKLEPAELPRYTLSYKEVGSSAGWKQHCNPGDGTANKVSFLVGKDIDGVTAEVHDAPEVTTMSCQTGAIDTCITWGYSPWNPQPDYLAASDYLFRTCLQAKRAAYFVGLGDMTSYTKSGTRILRRDQYGIYSEAISNVEAIWSPHGAVCLNPEHRRHGDLPVPAELLSQVPVCNPAQWSRYGKLATGPFTLTRQ